MGVYHYFLRKPHLITRILGKTVPVHSFKFAFKYHYNPEDERRAQLICDNAARFWEGKPLPQFCFVGEMPTREERAKSWLAPVYTNLTNYGWVDTNKFPGTCVGGLWVSGPGGFLGKAVFLNACDYLVKEHERSIEAMMCSPTQPGIQIAKNQIEYLNALHLPGNHDDLWSVDELRNGKVMHVGVGA